MGRSCTVCDHAELAEINRLLVSGDSIAGIARGYAVSEDSLWRHKESHVPKTLAASPSTKDVINGDNLLDQLQQARQKAVSLPDMAIEAADTKVYGAPSNYLREIREQIKLWAELEGRLALHPQINFTQVSIYNAPEWFAVGDLLAKVLSPYPELRAEVAKELLVLQEAHK